MMSDSTARGPAEFTFNIASNIIENPVLCNIVGLSITNYQMIPSESPHKLKQSPWTWFER